MTEKENAGSESEFQRGVSEPAGKLKPVEITNFSENKAAIYFDVIFEDENGKRWEAQFNSKFKFDLVAC